MDYIRKETWSPYIAGALLGVTGVLAVLLSNSLLGASGAFENVAGLIGKAVAPATFDNMYFNFIMPPGITWSVVPGIDAQVNVVQEHNNLSRDGLYIDAGFTPAAAAGLRKHGGGHPIHQRAGPVSAKPGGLHLSPPRRVAAAGLP